MPELPDIVVYAEALASRLVGQPVLAVRLLNPFLLRTAVPPIEQVHGKHVRGVSRLHAAARGALREWTERLRRSAGPDFPEKVTAFRADFAVHGKFGQPCPVCGAPVQRIVYAENETDYCARCQTGGVVLADRSLSRLLKKSWPRSIDELG